MADTKISALTTETSFNGTEQIPIVSSVGTNKKILLYGIAQFTNATFPTPIYVVKLRGTSTGAAAKDLTTDGAAHDATNEWVIDNGYAFLAEAKILAIDANGDVWTATQIVCVQRIAGSGVVSLRATATPTTIYRSANATDWSVTLTADSANGGAYYVGAGTSAVAINWFISLLIFTGI